jgi:hypothetical protein
LPRAPNDISACEGAILLIAFLLFATGLGAVAFAALGVCVARRFVRPVWGSHSDAVSAVFQTGGTIYAVFLAFLVVAVWQSHDAAHANIADEASVLSTLYRGSTAMEPQSGGKLRSLIREYTHAVIDDEWPVQAARGGASERARSAGLGLFQVFGAMAEPARQSDSSIDQLELGLIGQVHADRNKRTLQAGEAISPLIWGAAISNGLLVVIMGFFLYTDRPWPQIVMCSMLATMIATLLCIVFMMEQPFGGLLPLQPDAFAHSLEVYESVDQTVASRS